MSKINIHRNTFLEKEELNKFVDFSAQKTIIEAMLSLSTSFGVVSPGGGVGVPFSMSESNNVGGVDIKGGYIITPDLQAFYVGDTVNFNSVPSDGEDYYIKAVCEQQNFEQGYVQVDASGKVSGSVNFAGLIRGQSSGVASCIRFIKDDGTEPQNNSVYQVVDIVNSNNIALSAGYPFIAEQQLRVIVLGSVPMGRRFTDEQLEGLYTYNVINFKYEKMSDFTVRAENEFYIGGVKKDTSGKIVNLWDDTRYDNTLCPYWKGFGGGVSEVFYFTIAPTPADAIVTMNGRETYSVQGENGLKIDWVVSKPGYFPKNGTYTINGVNTTLPVVLEENPAPAQSTITVQTETGDSSKGSIGINNPDADQAKQSLQVITGESVTLYAKPEGINQFLGWFNGTALISNQTPFIYAVNGTVTIQAKFDEYWDLEVLTKDGEYESFGVPPVDGSILPERFLVKVGSAPVENFLFVIVPTPADAIVTINGIVRKSISVPNGTPVPWSVAKTGFVTKSGSQTIAGSNVTLPVALEADSGGGDLPNTVAVASNPTYGGTSTVAKTSEDITLSSTANNGYFFSYWEIQDVPYTRVLGRSVENPYVIKKDNLILKFNNLSATAYFGRGPIPTSLVTEVQGSQFGSITVTPPEPNGSLWTVEAVSTGDGIFIRMELRYLVSGKIFSVDYDTIKYVNKKEIGMLKAVAVFSSPSGIVQPTIKVIPANSGTVNIVASGDNWVATAAPASGYEASQMGYKYADGSAGILATNKPSITFRKSNVETTVIGTYFPIAGFPVEYIIPNSAVLTQSNNGGGVSLKLAPESGYGLLFMKMETAANKYNQFNYTGNSFSFRLDDEPTKFIVHTRSLVDEKLYLVSSGYDDVRVTKTGSGAIGTQMTLTLEAPASRTFMGWQFYGNDGALIKTEKSKTISFMVTAGQTVVKASVY